MPKLILMVGLPRSGKTTRARQLGHPIVSPDAIRHATHGQRFSYVHEGRVWETARLMVRALFIAGHSTVVLDATNVTRGGRGNWKSDEWTTAFLVVGTDAATCRQRAIDAGDEDILSVIERMSAEWEPLTEDELSLEERDSR
jgi:predicted kinase